MMICSEYEANPRVTPAGRGLAARGDDVTVLALHADGRPREEVVDGVRVVHAPDPQVPRRLGQVLPRLYGGFFVHATGWMLRRPRAFDLVQAHTMPEASRVRRHAAAPDRRAAAARRA